MAAALMLGFTESTDFPSFLDIIQSSFLDAFSTRPSRQQLIFEIATMTFFFFFSGCQGRQMSIYWNVFWIALRICSIFFSQRPFKSNLPNALDPRRILAF
jgi:hypothetical protein